jgi:hypothetical protein
MNATDAKVERTVAAVMTYAALLTAFQTHNTHEYNEKTCTF